MPRNDALDSTIDIVTPENIVFHYRLAGPFQRLPAFLLDVGIRLGVAVAAAMGVALAFGTIGLGDVGTGITLVFWFALSWFYGGYFETVWNGQTPGKRMFGLRVLTTQGLPINAGQAVMRNILRAADAFPMLLPFFGSYLIGLIASMMNDRYQRLGDLACSTMVVVEERRRARDVLRVSLPGLAELTATVPATFRPSRSLARTLANYVGRRAILSPERRKEIADVLGPILAERFGLPAETNSDLLLCAVYCRAFGIEPEPAGPNSAGYGRGGSSSGGSPFRPPGPGADEIPLVIVPEALPAGDRSTPR